MKEKNITLTKNRLKTIPHIDGLDGLLFVGDPQLYSKNKSNRKDESFMLTILNKLEQSVAIANENNLCMIILGDLLEKHNDKNIDMITKLIRVFRKAKYPIFTVDGNHDKNSAELTDDLVLTLLGEAGVVNLMTTSNFYASFTLNSGLNVLLGATPYGEELPTSVTTDIINGEKKVVWITHHDLNFDVKASYPDMLDIQEIEGVNILVNGHIHKYKEPITVGNMIAHNPGNITRVKRDEMENEPSVWAWDGINDEALNKIPLTYEKDVFLFRTSVAESIVEKDDTKVFNFIADIIKENKDFIDDKTDDGARLESLIKHYAQKTAMPDDYLGELLDIASETVLSTNA